MTFKAIPILRIFDETRAKEFYVNFLGMNIDWEHRFEENTPVYLRVSREDLVFHLSEHSGDGTPGTRVLIATDKLDDLFNEMMGKKYKYNHPAIETAPWGDRVMECIDPFSNTLLFNEAQKT
ncbi:MAG: glyoxalase superfamily protein [bacterium]